MSQEEQDLVSGQETQLKYSDIEDKFKTQILEKLREIIKSLDRTDNSNEKNEVFDR